MANQRERATIDLVINGQQSQASLRDITAATVAARRELNRMAETDPGYARQRREVEALMRAQQQRIVRINEEMTAWQKFKANAGGVAAGMLGGNLVEGGLRAIVGGVQAVIDHNLKLRDSFADIQKATDMTDAEVRDLNEGLKGIDTRTPTEELRNMAVVAGQFGIAKDQVEGFVESADKMNVALGDQFDSAEKVAEVTLTLRNTFQDIKTDRVDEDMLHIGNALNYLEAQGAATAPVMADFGSRIGGVAIPLGLTSGEVLGLSATLQELNVTSERGSTAVVDILNGMAKAPDAFAKYAKGVDGASLSTKEFKNLVNTDMNAALMAVIRGFKDGDTSATGMAAKLADMDIKGNGVMEVFMKLASNTDLLTQRQGEAATALTNTSSITGEFSKKNHELAVNLKRLGEWFDNFLENGFLTRFADGVVRITVSLLGLNRETQKATGQFRQQKTEVEDLTKKLQPLVERHDQLTKKSKLSRDEQAELSKVTQQIAAIMPNAVTQFDDYGRAIGVSTGKARELLDVQRELLKTMNKEAIGEQQQQLRNLEWQRAQIQKKLKSRENVTVSASGGVTVTPLSPADIAKLQKDLETNYQQTQDTLRSMKELEGNSTADRRAARRERLGENKPADKPKPNADFGTLQSEDERKEQEKQEKKQERANKKSENQAQQHQEELERMLVDAAERTAKINDDAFAAEQIQLGSRYSKMYELAAGNKDKMAAITVLMNGELAALQKQEDERQVKEQQKRMAGLVKAAEEELKLKHQTLAADVEGRVGSGAISKEAGKAELLQIEEQFLDAKELLYQAHYQALEKLAGGNAKLLAEIQTEAKVKQAEIDGEQTTNAGNQATARADIRTAEVKHELELLEEKRRFAREDKEFRQQMLGELSSMLMNDWTGTLQGYKDYWKQITLVQKAALIASKAWALAEIAINLSRQIILINTAARAMDAVLPGSGVIFQVKGLATAIGTAALQTAKVAAAGAAAASTPKFAAGGFNVSDEQPAGYTNGSTYYRRSNFIAGEGGLTEWIMGGPMLANPIMANLARALQAVQSTGAFKNLSWANAGGGASGSTSDALLMQMLAEQQQTRQAFEQYAQRPINYDHFSIRDKAKQIDYISTVTQL